jgi:hypothetical protein
LNEEIFKNEDKMRIKYLVRVVMKSTQSLEVPVKDKQKQEIFLFFCHAKEMQNE